MRPQCTRPALNFHQWLEVVYYMVQHESQPENYMVLLDARLKDVWPPFFFLYRIVHVYHCVGCVETRHCTGALVYN